MESSRRTRRSSSDGNCLIAPTRTGSQVPTSFSLETLPQGCREFLSRIGIDLKIGPFEHSLGHQGGHDLSGCSERCGLNLCRWRVESRRRWTGRRRQARSPSLKRFRCRLNRTQSRCLAARDSTPLFVRQLSYRIAESLSYHLCIVYWRG